MIDCFGIDVSEDEIRRWNILTAGPGPIGFGTGERLTQLYDPSSPQWQSLTEHFFEYFFPIPRTALTDMVVLELGCGPGYNASVLFPFIREFVGLDISPFCIAFARYRFARVSEQ